ELKTPLEKDSTYCFQVYMSLADSSQYAIKNKLGVFFSQNEIDSSQVRFQTLSLIPQIQFNDSTFFTDTKNWTKVNASFVAQGGEKFMTIGRFAMESLDTLKLETGGKAKPYEQVYYYLDDVYLGNCDSLPLDTPNGLRENILKTQLKVYPNPTTGKFVLENQSNQQLKVRLFSILGKEISTSLSLTKADGSKIELSLEGLPNGIYFLNVLGEGRESTTIKIVKSNY
ncbi:MAG: T9SS type A sorting domain-containing protein, partial [Flavobacteriales bacterium]|nr:T9SS type A sorting domain-containing protein [Flavobacteriales bacterium]